MWRSIDAHLKTIRLPLRTILLPQPNTPTPSLPFLKLPHSRHFSSSRTLTISPIPNPFSRILAFNRRQNGIGTLVVVRCASSLSSSMPNSQYTTVDWNEPVSCSEVGDEGKSTSVEEDTRPSIPVRAYFFSTRFVFLFIFLRNTAQNVV